MWYTLEQRAFLCDTYVKYGSARKCRRKFRHKFRDEGVPRWQIIHNFVSKLRTTGLLINKTQKHKRQVFTWEKLADTGARLEHTPRKSLKCLIQEIEVSKSTARMATQLLKFRPYKTTVIHAHLEANRIQLAGFISAVGFCSLSSKVRSICNWHSFLMKIGFTCRDT
jgi:hypothetical protein